MDLQVFSHLPVLYKEHHEAVRNRVHDDYEMHTFDYLIGVGRDFGYYLLKQHLELRLVSRDFNRAITRVWFQHETLKLRAFDYVGLFANLDVERSESVEKRVIQPNSINRIKEFILPLKSFAPNVKRLRIELSSQESWHSDGRWQWTAPDSKDGSAREERENALVFLKLLPTTIARMERLESLTVDMLQSWQSEYGGDENDTAPQLDLAALDELQKSLYCLFSSSPDSLRFLTNLRLTLPCTYNFANLNDAMSDDATSRLRHLYLEYVDATGPGGDRSYLIWAEDDTGEDGDGHVPLSNLQQKYPNVDYMPRVCAMVDRCRNLESLALYATHYLDLDTLSWQPNGKGLRNISIERAIVPFHTLRQLLSASDGDFSNVVALKLNYVQLLDHTWSDVFDHLLKSDTMKYFSVDDLNYAHRGESAHLREYNNRQWENSNTIWTENEVDKDRLNDLVKRVLDAGGLVGRDMGYVAEELGYLDERRYISQC